ncbi:hypothetical protein V2J09_008990 [Rumex salicifolius]
MAPPSFMATFGTSVTHNALRAYMAEFISTFLFVLAAAGSSMSCRKSSPEVKSDPSSLVAVALANAFGLAAAVYVSALVSGGHVNPAVTFAKAVGGHIPITFAIFYWISQMLGSVLACLLLKIITVSQNVVAPNIAEEMTGFGASILEGTMTFMLVFVCYAATDPTQGVTRSVGPIVIGLICGAYVLAAGPFSGGIMNPAYAFGTAVVGGSFRNHAVYWVGPLVGAAIAGILYDNVVIRSDHQDSAPL